MARLYAGWGFSQAFYWDQVYRKLGYSSLEDFLVGFWEGFFLDGRDANNVLTMLWTWQNRDIGQTPGFDGDHVKALESISAKAIVMPAEKDLYFPPEDEESAVRHMASAEAELRDPRRLRPLRRWRGQRHRHEVPRRCTPGAACGLALSATSP